MPPPEIEDCCIVCCGDVRKFKHHYSFQPRNYNLLGLLQYFCKYFNCDVEYFFGTSDVDFSRQKFPFCCECKYLLVQIYRCEDSIKSILREIEGIVRKLTARCLSCQRKNCRSCQRPWVANSDPTIGLESEELTHLLLGNDLQDSLAHGQLTKPLKKGPLPLPNHLRSKIGQVLTPTVIVNKDNLEELAAKKGLKILEPYRRAPNLFVPAANLFDGAEEDNFDDAASVCTSEFFEASESIANVVEINMESQPETAGGPNGILDDAQPVVDGDNGNDAHNDNLDQYEIDGAKVFRSLDGNITCNICSCNCDLKSCPQHYEEHARDCNHISKSESVRSVSSNPTLRVSTRLQKHVKPEFKAKVVEKDAEIIEICSSEDESNSKDDDEAEVELNDSDDSSIKLRTRKPKTKVASPSKRPPSQFFANGERIRGKRGPKKRKPIFHELEHEKPAEFASLFQFLEVTDEDGVKVRFSVQKVDEDDGTMVLENTWPFRFREGEGYECAACEFNTEEAMDFVDHCKTAHPDFEYDIIQIGSKLWSSFTIYRGRLRNALEDADEGGRDSLTTNRVMNKSKHVTKIFDLITKCIGENLFEYDGKHRFHLSKTHFHCDACEFQEEYKSVFIHHLFEAHIDEQCAGKFIPISFSYLEEISPNKFMYRNLPAEKFGDVYHCGVCKKFTTEDKSCMQRHLYRSHYSLGRYACKFCNRNCYTSVRLAKHVKLHEGQEPGTIQKIIKPPKLIEVEPNKYQYGEHSVTLLEDTYSCCSCKFQTQDVEMLKRHLYRRHFLKWKWANDDRPPLQKICEFCGKVFKSKNGRHVANFSSHVKIHLATLKPGNFICDKCGKSFISPMRLRGHMNKVHAEKKVPCDLCEMRFVSRVAMQEHRISHFPEKHFHCADCNVSFKRKDSYARHLKVHGGARPYSCDICGKSYTQSYDVVKHKKAQHGI